MSSRSTRALATLLAAMAVLVVAFPGNGTAADPDIGPLPGACPPSTPPSPYPARHDYCVRTSEHATLSIDPATISAGSEFTVSIGLTTPTCARQVADRTYPCVEHIGWDHGGPGCGIGSRLIANNRTFFNNANPPFYYRPFSILPVSPCRGGTVDPATDLTRVFRLVHNPGIGLIPASWLVVAPEIRVQLSATQARFAWPEAVARLSPTPVDNAAPVATFSWTPEPSDPLTIEFDGSASSDDKGVTRYEWSFDDGSTGTGQTAEHTFAAAGTYRVRLTVFDEEGLSGTTTRDVVIEGRSIALSLDAATPQPQGVQRTQRIVYTITAQPDERADELTVSATVPTQFVEIDESTIPGGGVVSADGKTVEWTLTNTTGTDPPLSFAVTVRADVPRSVLFISTEARAHATFGDEEANASTLRQTPLIQFGLVLTGDFVAQRGDHVVPKEFATIRLQADAREEADEIVLDAFVPKGSHLVPGSITGGGVQDGERAIRWRFTNVRETPIVTFQIKVDALEDIPKDLKKLQSKTTAEATFDDVPESAENTLEIDLVRPTTIRGVALDIVQSGPARLAVQTPSLAGVEVKLSELLSRKVVDTAASDGSGSFSVETGKPMRYVLEALRTVPTTTYGSRPVFSRHIIEVREEGEVWINGRLQPALGDGTPKPLDVYVPVSLVSLADEQLVSLGKTDIPYWLFLKWDIGPALDFANSLGLPLTDIRFDTTEVTRVLDSALALSQTRPDGSPAQFGGLYEPGNPATERDGWNAVLRLNAMLAQLGGDSANPRRFGDALTVIRPIALAIALQVTTTAIDALSKKLKWPRASEKWRFYRIGFMTEGVGVVTPLVIDLANLGGAGIDKAKWVEWVAKGSRYAMDILMGFFEKVARWGTLRDDVTFEVIFNAVRVGVTGVMLDGWINLMAQRSLDNVGVLKSTFAGSTSGIDRFVGDTERRLSSGLFSAGNAQKLATIEATVVSLVRGLDGILGTWKGAYGDARPRGLDKLGALQKALAGSSKHAAQLKHWALAVNLLAIEAGVVGLELLGIEVDKLAAAVTLGAVGQNARRDEPMPVTRGFAPSSSMLPAESPVPSARDLVAATVPAGSAIPEGAVAGQTARLRAAATAFRIATVQAAKAIAAPRTRETTRRLVALDRTSARTATALEPVLRRALLLQSDERAIRRQRAEALVTASLGVAEAQLTATSLLEARRGAASTRVVRAARVALRALAAQIRRLERTASASRSALGSRLPATLVATRSDLAIPDDASILSGRPFTARLTVWNAGDVTSAPGQATIATSSNLVILGRPSTSLPRLLPGRSATLTWRLRARRSDAPGVVLGNLQVLIERNGSVATSVEAPIVAVSGLP